MKPWNKEMSGDQRGKVVIVTGGASGIGLEAATALSDKGAEIILAVRNVRKGERAAEKIRYSKKDAQVSVMHLDLEDLESIEIFSKQFSEQYDHLDILINNAGVMVPPFRKTKNGFELQFGTNHLGHFALTLRLLPLLISTHGSRVVTVSSIASRSGFINFDNLDGSQGYNPMTFYRQSKLANLLFAIELNNRLKKYGADTISLACHPGISSTNLISRGSGREVGWILRQLMKLVAQPAEMGALPTLYAATHQGLKGGEYIGPDGRKNHRGYPEVTRESESLFKADVSDRLWKMSEMFTGLNMDKILENSQKSKVESQKSKVKS